MTILATINLLYFKHQLALLCCQFAQQRLILAIAPLTAWTLLPAWHLSPNMCTDISDERSSLVSFLSAIGKCSLVSFLSAIGKCSLVSFLSAIGKCTENILKNVTPLPRYHPALKDIIPLTEQYHPGQPLGQLNVHRNASST